MVSSAKKIVAVVGATGIQGGSVARTFLSLSTWHVRCLTRNPSSDAAKELASLGAEIVQADLSDRASLAPAFDNANAIFFNTNFWEVFRRLQAAGQDVDTSVKASYDDEVANGKNAIAAAAEIKTLERFVYSALGPMNKASKGKFQSYHWEAKNKIVETIEEDHPELAKRTSLIYLGGYNTNAFLAPKLNPNTGEYGFVLPVSKEARIPIIDPAKDTGPFVRALIEDEAPGTKLLAYSESSYYTFGGLVGLWEKVTGKKITYTETTMAALHELTKIPYEVLVGAAYLGEFEYAAGVEGLIEPDQLKTKVQTTSFEEWLRNSDVKDTVK